MPAKVICLLIAVGLLLSVTACAPAAYRIEPSRTEVSGLQVGTVQKQAFGGYEAAGTVKAAQVAAIAPQTTGRVSEVLVREGNPVRQGQTLIILTAPDTVQRTRGAEQQMAAAAAARQLADATYARTLTLFQSEAISKQELDRALAAQQGALAEEARSRAAIAEAESIEEYLTIRSPYNGVVTRQLAETGMLVSPAQPLVTIEDSSHYEIEVWVDVAQSGQVRTEMMVEVQKDDGLAQQGKVLYVSPSAMPDSRSFLVKIIPLEGEWRTGEYARIRFPIATKEQLMVPKSAVKEKGQLTGVYVVGPNNVLSFRLLRLGRTAGEQIEVLAGLTGQEYIVVGGVEQAVDGALWKGERP